MQGLSNNPSITPEFIEKYIDRPWTWGWCGLSNNPSITPEFIEKHIDKPWSFNYLDNQSIPFEFIEKHIDSGKPWDWRYCNISNYSPEIKRNKAIFDETLFEIDNRSIGKLPDEFKDFEIKMWKGKKVIGYAGIKFIKGLYQDY